MARRWMRSNFHGPERWRNCGPASWQVTDGRAVMGPQKTGFEGTTRLSDYLPLADGTRLAYDLILPAIDGRPSGQPLPALFKYTP